MGLPWGWPWEILQIINFVINLIPNEEKKRMARDFYFRLVVVFFVMLGVSFLIAFVAILPSYFLSMVKKNEASAKLAMQRSEPMPELDQKTLTEIKGLNSKLNLIENARQNKYSVSQKVINEIIFKKTSDIKITQIIYQNDLSNGKTINVKGDASSRETLLSFRQALEEDANFKKVNLPISNFVKGSHIKFYFNLIPS